MPQLQPFGGEPERRPADFDYEVRRSGHLSTTEQLWAGKRLILTTKPSKSVIPLVLWPAGSRWERLSIVHSEKVQVAQRNGEVQETSELSCDLYMPDRDRTLVTVYFESESNRVRRSGAIHPLQMCSFGAGRAIYDAKDQLLLTTYAAWRDSETQRGMSEGYVVHAQVGDELHELAAIVMTLITGPRKLVAPPESIRGSRFSPYPFP